MNVTELLKRGQDALDAEHNEKELKKRGVLRGANAGCLVYRDDVNFDVIGKCPRQAYARLMGLDSPIAPDKKIMFAMGHANEDIWVNLLQAGNPELKIEREPETEWEVTTERGEIVKGSCRIDLLLHDSHGVPSLGIELKNIHSVWKAKDHALELTPDLGHLIQTANSMYRLEQKYGAQIPVQLWYTNYNNLAGPEFIYKTIPERGSPLSRFCDYTIGNWQISAKGNRYIKKKHVYIEDQDKSNEYLKSVYDADGFQFKQMKPFRVGFELQFDSEGSLQWRSLEFESDWNSTEVTKQGIDDYYQMVADMQYREFLPPIVKDVDVYGEKLNYSYEDFSYLQRINDQAGDNVSMWYDSIDAMLIECGVVTKKVS